MSEFYLVLGKKSPLGDNPDEPVRISQEGIRRPNPHSITIKKYDFRLFADITPNRFGTIWEGGSEDRPGASALIAFGWCYRMGSGRNHLGEADARAFVHSHRTRELPDAEPLSGTYCLVSYDHVTETVWVSTDMWAQHSFYYGSNDDVVVIASKASLIANLLRRRIDGVTYAAHLRGCDVPPGRTLYAGVYKATCGRAVRLDLRERTARLVQLQPLYRPVEKASFAQAVDRFVDVITRVIPPAVSDPGTLVDLSGGNDTRMTAAVLASADGGSRGKAVTWRVAGPDGHLDRAIAGKIAALYGWKLIHCRQDEPENAAADELADWAVLSDGKFLLPYVAGRLALERRTRETAGGLLGSIAGELFRDYFWRQELHRIGISRTVNQRAFLKHKLYASPDADLARVSGGALTLEAHDRALMQPYADLDASLPDILNVYKLDRYYHFKLMHSTWSWNISHLRRVMYPFHSQEITLVSMRIPWRHRLGRRLITTGVRRLAPELAAIPTDDGAPMEPVALRNLPLYCAWVLKDVSSSYRRHFSRKKFAKYRESGLFVPRAWCDIVASGAASRSLYDSRPLLEGVMKKNGRNLSRREYLEMHALLLVEMIAARYHAVVPGLAFESEGARISNDSHLL
ncbi:MAG: hypothetical protein HY770_04265 [Chitinivibrionia bacterium]|nr:hypothetical protein [Chitinivibrionia bacterium]